MLKYQLGHPLVGAPLAIGGAIGLTAGATFATAVPLEFANAHVDNSSMLRIPDLKTESPADRLMTSLLDRTK